MFPVNNKIDLSAASEIFRKKWFAIGILFVAAALMILPMALRGPADGYDLLQHVRFAQVYQDAIQSGRILPAWGAADNFGFGSIGIRYYPAVSQYLLALTNIFTGDWYDSFWIDCLGWMFLSGVGVYLWVREWADGMSATAAGVLFIVMPYHTFQIYHFFLYAEFSSAAILPFCFLYLTRLCRRPNWTNSLLFAIACSLLMLTHIPNTIIAGIGMAVYFPLIVDRSRVRSTVTHLAAAASLTLLATSFHWLKIATEMSWVMHNLPQYSTVGAYDYHQGFFPIVFFTSLVGYLQRFLVQLDAIFVIVLFFFVPAVIAAMRPKFFGFSTPARKVNLAVLMTGLAALFMSSCLSVPLWNSITQLQKLQFPWRWLALASLFASVSFGLFVPTMIEVGKKYGRKFLYPLLLFVTFVVIFDVALNMIPSNPLSREIFSGMVENIKQEPGCDCWWPVWANKEAFASKERAVAGERSVDIKKWEGEDRSINVAAGEATDLRIATFFHPYWKATVNGQPVTVEKDENGVIEIPLGAEESAIHLYFDEPKRLGAAKIVSIVTWFLMLTLLVAAHRRKPAIL